MSSPWSPITPEIKARRRKRLILWIVLGLLLLAAAFAARPAYHFAKRWRARGLAATAESLIAAKQWKEALPKVQSASQLAPAEPAVVRAVAHFYSGVGNPAGFGVWRTLLSFPSATIADRRDAVRFCLTVDQLDFAQEQLSILLQAEPQNPETLELAAQLALQKGDRGAALEFTRRLLSLKPADPHLLLRQARLTLLSPDTREQRQGRDALFALSEGSGEVALEALQALAGWPALPPDRAETVAAGLEKHPAAHLEQRLAAVALRIRVHPLQRAELVEGAIAQAAGASPDELPLLGRWLLQHGAPERVLDLITPAAALTRQDLFLVRADALAALGRWAEIQETLKTEKTPLDPSYVEIFLARAARELGEDRTAEAHWLAALSAAQKPPQTLFVAQYAEKTGNRGIAIKAWRELARVPGWGIKAHLSLLPLLEATGDTLALRDAVRELVKISPHDPSPRNDLAYLDLLLKENVPAALKVATELFRLHPDLLAYRNTLALAYLRSGAPENAEELYRKVHAEWSRALPRFQAVRAAALAKSIERLSGVELDQIDALQLLPEEHALVQAAR